MPRITGLTEGVYRKEDEEVEVTQSWGSGVNFIAR